MSRIFEGWLILTFKLWFPLSFPDENFPLVFFSHTKTYTQRVPPGVGELLGHREFGFAIQALAATTGSHLVEGVKWTAVSWACFKRTPIGIPRNPKQQPFINGWKWWFPTIFYIKMWNHPIEQVFRARCSFFFGTFPKTNMTILEHPPFEDSVSCLLNGTWGDLSRSC